MAANFDVKPHADMWHSFVGLFLRGALAVAVLLALMAIFLL
jgi:hypothetical protein